MWTKQRGNCERFLRKLNEPNSRACQRRGHKTCLDATAYYHKPSGKVFGTHNKEWKSNDWTSYEYRFDDYASEVKAKFKAAGYVIKPTGYIGGVWQLTEDIMW